jgi:hypothetical protein
MQGDSAAGLFAQITGCRVLGIDDSVHWFLWSDPSFSLTDPQFWRALVAVVCGCHHVVHIFLPRIGAWHFKSQR